MSRQISSPKSWVRENPKTTLCFIIVIATLTLDFTLTAIYHLYKYGSIHKQAALSETRTSSPYFHHTLKPNVAFSYERWGHITHALITNSLGFRDETVRDVPLVSNQFRVLFLGDSFTEGVGVNFDKSFVGIIGRSLKPQDIEVLNAGVVSYSPTIYFKKTEHLLSTLGLKFDHVVVFLDISDIQDEARSYDMQNNQVIWIQPPDPVIREFVMKYFGLLGNIVRLASHLYEAVAVDPTTLRTEEEQRYAINDPRGLWTVDQTVFSEYGKAGLQKAKQHMDQLHALLIQHDIGLTLAVYPWPDQIIHFDLDSIQVKEWKEWANHHHVQFMNYFPDFMEKGQNPKDVIRKYFIPGDSHWNESGHQRIAQKFLVEWNPPRKNSNTTKSSSQKNPNSSS